MPTPASATGVAINGTAMCFIRAQPLISYTLVDPNPVLMCGSLDHLIEKITPGIQHHGWRILLQPDPAELDVLVPLIGYNEDSTDTFTPTDTLTAFTTLVKLKSTTQNAISTTNCVVDKAVFRGQKGGSPVSLQLDIIGRASAETATYSPATLTADAPYPFTDGTLSVGGTSRDMDQFVLVHDNHVAERFNNSVTADALHNTQRTIHLGANSSYDDTNDDIFTTFISSTRHQGLAAVIGFSRSNKSLSWSFTKVVWDGTAPPAITGKDDEVRLFQWYKAVSESGAAICTLTQDNTG